MNLKVEELEKAGFQIQDELDHTDILPLVQRMLKEPVWFARAYWALNIFLLCALITSGFWLSNHNIATGERLMFACFTGIALSLLLMPIHEVIHGLAYKLVGAPKVSYHAHWKQLIFMAVAHQFVANRREFTLVALAPFVVISICLLAGALVFKNLYSFAFLSMCLAHASMCSGDFALLAYFQKHADKELVTYDDQYLKKSWFLVR